MLRRNVLFGFALTLTLAAGCGAPPIAVDGGGDVDGGGVDASTECPTGTSRCGTQCVDTDETRAHCGACDNACAAGEACVEGACDVVCPSTQTECDGACADTTSDRLHCGACGTACDAGEICIEGACELSCPAGQVACGASCVDTASNAAHCGACDAACDAGAVCSVGECATTCGDGLVQCGASCVDTQNHPDHCGACDMACAGDTAAGALCMAGACRLTCDASQGDCDADLGVSGGNGCETATATDPANCGACGLVCEIPNAVAGCAASACTIASCETGFDDCDGALANGCEAELATDVFNCGACGTVCTAGDQCVAGACAPIHGEDCSDPIVLTAGANTVVWTASYNDYLVRTLGCTTESVDGPDVVLSYTATVTEQVTIAFDKPASTRWVAVSSLGTCGAVESPVACTSEYTELVMSSTFIVPAGQTVYVHLIDTVSGTLPLSNPLTVNVTAVVAPCAPGVGGIIGTTTARVPTGITTSFTEYFVAAEEGPTGNLYVGSTTALHRIAKDGSTASEDIEAIASLAADHLGYVMLIDGPNIFIVNETTTGPDNRLWRVSTDSGATWNPQDYAFFPTSPLDGFRAATVYGGRIYLVTDEGTATNPTQIWSVDAAATTLPAAPTLEVSFTGDTDCLALARDATHFYMSCDDPGDRIVRVPVAGGAVELVTAAVDVSATANSLVGDDLDADGVFDVLYAHGQYEDISFVCDLASATPFAATLVDLGGASGNYGMAFDRTENVLWTYDDDTEEFVSVQ